jgi:hypothetical protein
MRSLAIVPVFLMVCACNMGPSSGQAPAKPDPAATAQTKTEEPKPQAPAPTANAPAKLGAPIGASPAASLTDIAKNPGNYKGKKIVTTGTVTAVCQEAGCWMEIKDEAGQAHIKMAGHSFFVPRSASGKKARVEATVLEVGQKVQGHHDDCEGEAEKQTGKPLPKLQLEAHGVEIL